MQTCPLQSLTREPRPAALLRRPLPRRRLVPVAAIADDVVGLAIDEADIDCSGTVLPGGGRALADATEPQIRCGFAITFEPSNSSASASNAAR